MYKLKNRHQTLLLLLVLTLFLLAVPLRANAANKYPFKYFKVGKTNIVSQLRSDPAYEWGGALLPVNVKGILYTGVRLRWKLNKGWHAELSYSTGERIRNGQKVPHFEPGDSIRIIAWKNGRFKKRKGHREVYYEMYCSN